MTRKTRVSRAKLAAFAVVCTFVLPASGCDQIKARRKIQDGNKLYNEGRYGEAADVYEQALAIYPDLEIGQHNAALANFRAFVPGDDNEANKTVAERAIGHFERYLEYQPDDVEMTGFLTTIWLDSGHFERAQDYWNAELAKDPKNLDVLRQMARINLAAGRHDETVKWLEARADIEETHESKVKAYLEIAKLQWSLLRKPDLVDHERLHAADLGIEALQKALKLEPKNAQVMSYLGSLYELRKLAHNNSWGQAVEAASERVYKLRWNALRVEAEKALKQQAKPESANTAEDPADDGEDN